MHSRFYGLTKSQIKSDGLDVCFDTLRSGRKNPELSPGLFDLVECLTFEAARVFSKPIW